MKNLTVKYGEATITLRPQSPMSEAIRLAYRDLLTDLYGKKEEALPFFVNIFLLLVPHTRKIEGAEWSVPDVSDMALMPGGLQLSEEEAARQISDWVKFTDDNLELYDVWVKGVNALFKPVDEDLAPQALPEDADPNAESGG